MEILLMIMGEGMVGFSYLVSIFMFFNWSISIVSSIYDFMS